MLIAERISDNPKKTKTLNQTGNKSETKELDHTENESKKRKRQRKPKKNAKVPKEWDPNDPIQLKYDAMIKLLTIPVGYFFWSFYFRHLTIPGCPTIILRVQRIARKKEDGHYETHAVMCHEGIPYVADTVDFFLEVMIDSEETSVEKVEELAERSKFYFDRLKARKAEELSWLKKWNMSLNNTAEEIAEAFITKLSRQFFQNSSLKIRLITGLST